MISSETFLLRREVYTSRQVFVSTRSLGNMTGRPVGSQSFTKKKKMNRRHF